MSMKGGVKEHMCIFHGHIQQCGERGAGAGWERAKEVGIGDICTSINNKNNKKNYLLTLSWYENLREAWCHRQGLAIQTRWLKVAAQVLLTEVLCITESHNGHTSGALMELWAASLGVLMWFHIPCSSAENFQVVINVVDVKNSSQKDLMAFLNVTNYGRSRKNVLITS